MKLAFQKPLARKVKLVHGSKDGEEVVELDIHPSPLGFRALVFSVLADPAEYVNGQPKGPDPKKEPQFRWYRTLVLVAKALGSQLDTQPPTSTDTPHWIAYAEAVERELNTAGFTSGDIDEIVKHIARIDNGSGNLGNAYGAGEAG